MTEALTQILIIEAVVVTHVFLALAFLKFRSSQVPSETVLAEDEALNDKAKALYAKLNKTEQLSLSLGREESKSSSRPSFFHFVCERDSEEWVLTS